MNLYRGHQEQGRTCSKCGIRKALSEFRAVTYPNGTPGYRPECIECARLSMLEYTSTPEYKEHRNEYNQDYFSRPDVVDHRREYKRSPEMKAYGIEYRQRPEVKARNRIKAAERQLMIKITDDGTINADSLHYLRYIYQANECWYCDIDLDAVEVHLDHTYPLSKGGLHSIDNVHYTCEDCNLVKGDKILV